MSKHVRSVVSLSALLTFSISSYAASPEQAWLEGAQTFDNAAKYGPVKGRAAAALGQLQAVYSGDEVSKRVERRAGEDTKTVELQTQIYRVVTTIEPVLETYEDLVCREDVGNSGGEWHGLFNAPRREKAARLAQAVKGVGDATAQCIIDSGAFESKPRTWSSFKTRMKKADEECGKGVYYRTIVQHGRANAQSLGYYSSERSCRIERVQELVIRPVERRIPERVVPVTVHLTFRTAPLRPMEAESILVGFDGVNVNVSPQSHYNRYQVSQSGANFVLDGHRQRVTPSNTLSLEILARGMGQVLRLTDNDHSPAIGIDSANVQTVAKIKVRQKGDWKRAFIDKTLLETSIILYGGSSSTDLDQLLGSSVKKGEKYYLEYSLSRMNSLLNNESSSSAKDSPEFTR